MNRLVYIGGALLILSAVIAIYVGFICLIRTRKLPFYAFDKRYDEMMRHKGLLRAAIGLCAAGILCWGIVFVTDWPPNKF